MLTYIALALTGFALIALMIDWLQTIYIAGHPTEYREINPLLGRHPSKLRVSIYFAACLMLSVTGAVWLVLHDRMQALAIAAGLTSAFEGYWVVHNWKIGIRISNRRF